MKAALGLDIGTTSTIGILIDVEGGVLAMAERPVTLRSPRPGWAEQDPEEWWANVGAVCRELIGRSGVPAADIRAIGAAGMLPAVVLLDEAGRPVRPSIQQSDGRCGVEVAQLAREVDEAAFLARTGQGITQQLVAPKLRWLARHEPAALRAARTLCGSYDLIAYRLTGRPSLEANWALEAGFVEIGRNHVASDLLAFGGVTGELLPVVREPADVVGTVTSAAAAHTGLAAGTPVVAGCADHVASAWVAGVRAEGDALVKLGGSGDFLLAVNGARPDRRLFLDYHILPDMLMPNGCMAASGSLLNWFVRTLGGGRTHAELDALAAAAPPGADGLVALPYFLGEKTPIQDPDARGVLIGLGLHHEAGHLWRALLEAVAFGFRHHVEVARELGYSIGHILASDGGTRSVLWTQIVADVLQHPLQLLDGHPGSCLGAAWVAAKGTGLTDDWGGVHRFVRPGRLVEPDRSRRAAYEEAYGLFRSTYEALRPLFPACGRLSAIARDG